MHDAAALETRLDALESQLSRLGAESLQWQHEKSQLQQEKSQLQHERDTYQALYLEMLALCRKLERGIVSQSRERFTEGQNGQLTMSVIESLVAPEAVAPPAPAAVEAHTRAPPTGRKPLPEKLPRVDIEVLPPEVQQAGLDAFERVGEDVSETVERRPASLVVVRIHKPKFILKQRDRLEDTAFFQAPPPELPIERGLAGPGLLADTLVRRWQDHLPLHRLERIYGRDGLELPRSTVCGWHAALAALVKPLVSAMWADALKAPYLCMDATGVLVQAKQECRRGHFWVVAAPEKHVLFGYSAKHDGAAVDALLKDYQGYLVADAHSVYEHLYASGDVVECGCWAHARRYFFKALTTDPERAKTALTFIGSLFRLERGLLSASPEARRKGRLEESQPVLEAFFAWCEGEALRVLDETPISKAIGYSRNQKDALCRFLADGRLPIHNNFSERELRREAVGRKNWLFLGNDDAGEVNATFVTLLASCQLHGLEPLAYLRDLFCLLPSWPVKRVLDLAPASWQQTLQQQDTQQRLAANVFRQVSLGLVGEHSLTK